MAEKYTYADVIISPNDPRAKIGEQYFVGESPEDILEGANGIEPALYGTLHKIFKRKERPFDLNNILPYGGGKLRYASNFIIRKKEEINA